MVIRKGRVTLDPQADGGLSIHRDLDLDETGQVVKNAEGQLYGWFIHNNADAVRYVKFYNQADAPDENDTPVITMAIPANAAANCLGETGIPFGTGIGFRATTGVADNDTGAPAANDVQTNLFYK